MCQKVYFLTSLTQYRTSFEIHNKIYFRVTKLGGSEKTSVDVSWKNHRAITVREHDDFNIHGMAHERNATLFLS